jgi:hypothetical protein
MKAPGPKLKVQKKPPKAQSSKLKVQEKLQIRNLKNRLLARAVGVWELGLLLNFELWILSFFGFLWSFEFRALSFFQ